MKKRKYIWKEERVTDNSLWIRDGPQWKRVPMMNSKEIEMKIVYREAEGDCWLAQRGVVQGNEGERFNELNERFNEKLNDLQ